MPSQPDRIAFRHDFLLKEYEAVQGKIKHSVDDLFRTEVFISVAVAAVYGWHMRTGLGFASPLILWVPPVLGVFGYFRQRARYVYIAIAENYIRKLESEVYGPTKARDDPAAKSKLVSGWETFLLAELNRKPKGQSADGIESGATAQSDGTATASFPAPPTQHWRLREVFWCLLIAATSVAAAAAMTKCGCGDWECIFLGKSAAPSTQISIQSGG